MAVVTAHQRSLMTSGMFAVPEKRALLIEDKDHVELAWDMIDRTHGLTPAERTQGRKRILARARELGISTKDWTK